MGDYKEPSMEVPQDPLMAQDSKYQRKRTIIIGVLIALLVVAAVAAATFAISANSGLKTPEKIGGASAGTTSSETTSSTQNQKLEDAATAAIAKCADPKTATEQLFKEAQFAVDCLPKGDFKAAAAAQLAKYAKAYADYIATNSSATAAQKAAAQQLAQESSSKASGDATRAQGSSQSGSGSSGTSTSKPGGSGGSGSTSGGGSSSGGGGAAKPTDPNAGKTWVPPTTQVIHHPAVYEDQTVAYWLSSDGKSFDTAAAASTYAQQMMMAGTPVSVGVAYKTVSVKVKDAWDETVTTPGYWK